MNFFYWVVLISLLVLFMATGILTLLAISRFGPKKKPIVTIEPKFLERLFVTLILEIVVLVLSIGGLAIDSLRESSNTIDQSSAQMAQTVATLDDMTLHGIINEPSGLVAFKKDGSIYGLVVDDEEPGLFLVEPAKSSLRFKKTIPLRGIDPEDLESITWDRTKWFYAATSFRQLGDEGKPSRKLLRFELPNNWTGADFVAAPEVQDISDGLAVFLSSKGIEIDKRLWRERAKVKDNWHPWALEIEGLAIRNNLLLLGLKWPLASDGKALVVTYSWEDREFKNLYSLSLDNKGVSDLAYLPQQKILLVAANPPAKERKENKMDEQLYFGRSSIYVFSWPSEDRPPELRHQVNAIARLQAKLEGVAFIGDEVWLAYDGPNHNLDRKPASILGLGE